MNFFWPTEPDPDPGILARLGRVLHWLSIALGAFFVAGGLAIVLVDGLHEFSGGFGFVLGGVMVALAGRGLRYILAGE